MHSKGADDFADCVIRRSSMDTIIRSKFILLMVILSLAFAAAISFVLCERYAQSGKLTVDSFDVVFLELISCMCCFFSFTLYIICRRVRDHHQRDIIWRRSIIDYLSSKGSDVKGLEEIDSRASAGHHYHIALVSFVIWAVSVVLSVVLVVVLGTRGLDTSSLSIIVQSNYLLLLVQFVCTLGTAVRYPSRHDALQVEFVGEMQPILEELGIHVDAMQPIVKARRFLVNVILFVITLGIYALYIVGSTTTDMNRHIYSQWGYEARLLSEIMRAEGAIGVVAVDEDGDQGLMARLIKGFT